MITCRLKKTSLLFISIVQFFIILITIDNYGFFSYLAPANNPVTLLISNNNDESDTPREMMPFHGYLVNAEGVFLDRVTTFNKALDHVRSNIMAELGTQDNSTILWTNDLLQTSKPLEIVWGAEDNYIEILATRHRHIVTLALAWQHNSTNGSSTKWNSLNDFSNVLVQRYYQWTADDKLCTLIETPGALSTYDAVFNWTCERNQSSAASHPRSIAPLFFNAKPICRNHYWPNNGISFPTHFYVKTPPFVFHLHVHRNAVVDSRGDVFSGNSALLLFLCRDCSTKPQTSLPSNIKSLPIFNEVFTVTQMWGTGVFHRMIEVIPRVVVYIDFFLRHPDIKVQVPGSAGDHLSEMLGFLGIEEHRLVRGAVRGNIIYQPRPTGCGTANVQESQILSKLYRDYIDRAFPGRNETRNRLILIRRSGTRRFTEHQEIETQLKVLAAEFGLVYELFADNPTPSLADTMKMFNQAVLIVGPHGAGLSNMLFSEPGTYVIEGVCNVPHVNLCFQRLAHVLGHRWHGVISRGGCEGVVDVATSSVLGAARTFLDDMNSAKTTVS